MSKIFKQIPTNATDFEIEVNGNDYLSISLADPDTGTQTGGVMTFEALAPGSADFEALSPNTINIGAPTTLKIDNQIVEKVRVTLAGFTGTATAVNLAFNDWGVIRP